MFWNFRMPLPLGYLSMARMVTFALLGICVAGCSTLGTIYSAATSANVPPALVIVAGNTFDAAEATATNYLTLKRCGSAPCRSPAATKVIIPAVRSGRVARNNLEQFLADHPGQLGPKGEYDALVAATNTLKSAFVQFGIQ